MELILVDKGHGIGLQLEVISGMLFHAMVCCCES